MSGVRYGIIGLSRAGKLHIKAALANPNVKLAAVVDTNQDLVEQHSSELNIKGFSDYKNLLDANIVDAVSIATPNHLHYPIGLACLEAGIHIFTEKPFTTRVSEADQLTWVANKKDLKICVNYSYRLHRSSQLVKAHIDSGAIGKILRVVWTWGHLKASSYYTDDPWRGSFQQSGGGVLMSNASHELDLIRWLVGNPVEVSAFATNHLHDIEVEDTVNAIVRFENGATGALQFTVNQPPAYSTRQIAGHDGIVVFPDVKSLYTDQNDEILFGKYSSPLPDMVHQISEKPGPEAISWHRMHAKREKSQTGATFPLKRFRRLFRSASHKTPAPTQSVMMDSFIDAILLDREPLVTGQSALGTMELINAIILSASRRKHVRLPLDRAEYDDLIDRFARGQQTIARYR